jgi:hypothetical protein
MRAFALDLIAPVVAVLDLYPSALARPVRLVQPLRHYALQLLLANRIEQSRAVGEDLRNVRAAPEVDPFEDLPPLPVRLADEAPPAVGEDVEHDQRERDRRVAAEDRLANEREVGRPPSPNATSSAS